MLRVRITRTHIIRIYVDGNPTQWQGGVNLEFFSQLFLVYHHYSYWRISSNFITSISTFIEHITVKFGTIPHKLNYWTEGVSHALCFNHHFDGVTQLTLTTNWLHTTFSRCIRLWYRNTFCACAVHKWWVMCTKKRKLAVPPKFSEQQSWTMWIYDVLQSRWPILYHLIISRKLSRACDVKHGI